MLVKLAHFVLISLIIIIFGSTPLTINSEILLPTRPICIVGAGISGLSLGNLLQEKRNERVIIFEKFGKIGGKIDTFRNSDLVQAGTGPVVFTPLHHSLIKYIKKFNLTPIPFNDSRVVVFEPYTGSVFPVREILRLLKNPLLEAAHRYTSYQAEYVKNRQLDLGYLEASKSPELFLSISKWLEEKNLGILKPIFQFSITQEGYGALEDTPMLYALKVVAGPLLIDLVLNTEGGLLIVEEGYDQLVRNMAQSLQIKVDHEVVQITRKIVDGEDGQEILTNNGAGQLATFGCKKIILAFPPLLPQLEKIVTDLTPEEKNVWDQVRVHKYTTAVHQIPVWRESLYASVGVGISNSFFNRIFMGNGNVVLFARQSLKKLDSVYSSYSWIRGGFTEVPTAQDLSLIENKLEATLRQINGGDLNGVRTFVRPTQKHPYFPHVNSTALRQGFYGKLDKIQGAGGLYFATTLLGFESMDAAIEMTEDFVQKYF